MGLRSRKTLRLAMGTRERLGFPALDSRSRTRATFSVPRPTSSPILNVLASSASSCATSSFSYQAGQAVTIFA